MAPRRSLEKLSRRAGVELGLKGARQVAGKSGRIRRPYPPGQQGRLQQGRRRKRDSDYLLQLKDAAQREAEAAVVLRGARRAAPALRRGQPPAASGNWGSAVARARASPRQRRLPAWIRRDQSPGAAVREPRSRDREWPAGQPSLVPAPAR